MKDIATKVLEVMERLYQTAIKTCFPEGPPVVLDSEHGILAMAAERRAVNKLPKAVLNISGGSFAMPSFGVAISGNDTSYIDAKVTAISLHDGNRLLRRLIQFLHETIFMNITFRKNIE